MTVSAPPVVPDGIAGLAPPSSRLAWPLERILFALAGTMTLLAAALAAIVSPWFLLLAAFVGLNQLLYMALGTCPASLVLARVTGREGAWCRHSPGRA